MAKEAKEKEAELQDVDELKKIKDTNKLEDKELIAKLCKCKLSESQEQTEDIKNNKEKGLLKVTYWHITSCRSTSFIVWHIL